MTNSVEQASGVFKTRFGKTQTATDIVTKNPSEMTADDVKTLQEYAKTLRETAPTKRDFVINIGDPPDALTSALSTYMYIIEYTQNDKKIH